ncbi:trypsin-like peptidase domain-containing protein [Streptomyces sp. SS7]|uniref:S1C family serine protease n=1 Tax=Streptomyces sp. SS7 TaxID=3108485 RepID=UPI0030ECDA48
MDEGTPREGASAGQAEETGAGTGDYELDLPLKTGADAAPPIPLHDPDAYSTPPYGHPGPWSPAPPVQHPATTLARAEAQARAEAEAEARAEAEVRADAEARAEAQARAEAAARAAGEAPASAQGEALPQTQAQGEAQARTQDEAQTPPPAPTQAEEQAPARPPVDAPAPTHAGIPTPAPTPAQPQSQVHGQAVPVPGSVESAAGVAVTASAAGAPSFSVPEGAAPGVVGASDPVALPAVTAPSGNPWHRYDPWAPVPVGVLQESGGAVLSEGERRRQVRQRIVGGALALALASGVLGGIVGAQLERNGGFRSVSLPQASPEPTGRAADTIAGIAARALPSVVTLHVSGSEESGTGTGFVLDTSGHILTNNHVVEPAGGDGDITVVFNGGQTAKADVVGRDSGYDLAVVKVKGVSGLRPLPLGNSDCVQVGDPVVAIGAPFDLEGTVTSGIISAKERPITAGGDSGDASDVSYVDALQTDAPINPGNSGGPLLDSRGRVIGINSAIRSAADGSDSGSGEAGSIGLGFAIPVNQGRRVAEELINTGHATHPVIGVTLDLDYAGDGARVSVKGGDAGAPVTPGGPGALAGIKAGDVITEVDGTRVHSGTELIVKTRAHRPGDRLELTVERDGRERTLSLVLGSAEGD